MNKSKRDQLVLDADPLIRKIASKLYRLPAVRQLLTYDDVCQVGRMGAIQAAQRFNGRRKIKFYTFATPRIYGAIMDAARDAAIVKVPRLETRRGNEIRLCKRVGTFTGDGEHSGYAAWIAEIEPRIEAAPQSDADYAIHRFQRTLSKRDRLVFVLCFGLGGAEKLRLWEVAVLVGVTQGRISQILQGVLRRAREYAPLRETQRIA